MPLTCTCHDDYDQWFYYPEDFSTLSTRRGRRCVSCGTWVRPGAEALQFYCSRAPKSLVEERIHGDEVPLPPKYMCETCGGLFFALNELGFCVELGESMRDLVAEYARTYGQQSKAEKRKEC